MLILLFVNITASAQNMGKRFPSEQSTFIDKESGVEVTTLTNSTAHDNKIYQTHPQWTSDGQFVIFRSDRGQQDYSKAFAVSMETGEIIQLTDNPKVKTGSLNLSHQDNKLYYFKGNDLIELDLDPLLEASKSGDLKSSAYYERIITALPKKMQLSGGFALDAREPHAYVGLHWKENNKDQWGIKSIDLQTGKTQRIIDSPFRVGHVQTNPEKPGEILYCHETGGDAPQRMWMVQADGSENKPVYEETPKEWVTHEVFINANQILFIISGHLPRLRTKPSGIASINLRTGEVMLHDQAKGSGFWHCDATSNGRWAVGDTFSGELYRIDLEKGTVGLLTAGHRPEGTDPPHSHHSISPDGRWVLFNSGLKGNSNLMIVPLQGELEVKGYKATSQ